MNKKKSYALEVTMILAAVVGAFFVQKFINSTAPPELPDLGEKRGDRTSAEGDTGSDDVVVEEEKVKVPEEYVAHLSDLGVEPDWMVLDAYQQTIRKEDFVRLLEEVYTIRGEWEKWVKVGADYAEIRTHTLDPSRLYKLHFRNTNKMAEVENYWRKRSEIKHTDEDLPLEGVRIVIDPGHIGGSFAAVEDRKFKLNESAPVQEGSLTLMVAKLLEDQLKVLGAEVDLTRVETEPVNPHRAEDYLKYAKSKMDVRGDIITKEMVRQTSEKLFYRAGEIRARGNLVNEEFKPDVVLCLHFNGAAWDEKQLLENEHLHIILHGAYTSGELAKDDQRLQLMLKLLQRCHEEERKVCASVANALALHTGLPPYAYAPESSRAVNVDNDPYLWARNLAANRAYQCPVVFCEPYLMNGLDSHARIQVGDYDGLRYVNGMLRPSIFREYVNALAEGLVNYYQKREISE